MTDHPFRSSTLTPPTAPPSPPIDGGNVFMWFVRLTLLALLVWALLALLVWGMVRGVGCVRSCNARGEEQSRREAIATHNMHVAGARAWLRAMHRANDVPIQCGDHTYYNCAVWPRGEPLVKLWCVDDHPGCAPASEVRP